MDGKPVPCVHRRSGWCLARSIKINLLRHVLGRYVLSFSKVKYLCGPNCSPVVLLLWHDILVLFFLFLFSAKQKHATIANYLHHVRYNVCSWDNHKLQCSQMEEYASRKSGKESLSARSPLRMVLAWCQDLVHTTYVDKRGGKIDKPDLE